MIKFNQKSANFESSLDKLISSYPKVPVVLIFIIKKFNMEASNLWTNLNSKPFELRWI